MDAPRTGPGPTQRPAGPGDPKVRRPSRVAPGLFQVTRKSTSLPGVFSPEATEPNTRTLRSHATWKAQNLGPLLHAQCGERRHGLRFHCPSTPRRNQWRARLLRDDPRWNTALLQQNLHFAAVNEVVEHLAQRLSCAHQVGPVIPLPLLRVAHQHTGVLQERRQLGPRIRPKLRPVQKSHRHLRPADPGTQ